MYLKDQGTLNMKISSAAQVISFKQNNTPASIPLSATPLPAANLSHSENRRAKQTDYIKGAAFFAGVFGSLMLLHQKAIQKTKALPYVFAALGAVIGYIHSEKH